MSASRRAARRPWRSRHAGNQLSDRASQTSRAKWHSQPYGFEIIGRGQNKSVFFSPYIDALRTVHLVCCEAVTVSSCLADNVAKGIHLKRKNNTARSERKVGPTRANKARAGDSAKKKARSEKTNDAKRCKVNVMKQDDTKSKTISITERQTCDDGMQTIKCTTKAG